MKIWTRDTSGLQKQLCFSNKMFEFSPFSSQNCLMKQTKLFHCINITFFQTTVIDKTE